MNNMNKIKILLYKKQMLFGKNLKNNLNNKLNKKILIIKQVYGQKDVMK